MRQPGSAPLLPTVQRLAGGAWLSTAGKVVGMGLDFLRLAIMARLLSVDGFGLYALAWSLLRVGGLSAPLGLHNGVIHFATRFWKKSAPLFRGLVLRATAIAVGVGAVAGLLLFLLAPWLSSAIFDDPALLPVLRWFAWSLPFMTGLQVLAATTRVPQRMLASTLANDLIPSVTNLLLFLLLFWLMEGVLSAVWATVLAFAAGFAAAAFFVARMMPHAAAPAPAVESAAPLVPVSTGALLRYSLPTAMAGFFGILMNRVDRIVIGFFRPAADVGIYQAASQIAVLFTIVLFGFNLILAPMMADLFHKRDVKQMNEIYRVSTKWTIYLSAPLFLTVLIVPEATMTALFGAPFAAGSGALLLIAVGQMINASTGAVGTILTMTGRQNRWLLVSASMFLVNVVLNLLLVPRYGFEGAATTTLFTLAGLYLTGLVMVRRYLGLWPYDARYVKGLVAAGTAGGAGLLLNQVLAATPWFSLLSIGAACALLFALLLLLQGLDGEDRALFQLLRSRLS
jgi:O-antigen/teichoic acid export membrane protein